MTTIAVRPVGEADAALLLSLAYRCPPLDVHTPYTYWVLSHMFRDGCFVALAGDSPVGFATSVIEGGRALLWQVGVLKSHQGRGISYSLIDSVATHARNRDCTKLELSISPENTRSLDAFRSFARRNSLQLERVGDVDLINEFDPSFREYEVLYALKL